MSKSVEKALAEAKSEFDGMNNDPNYPHWRKVFWAWENARTIGRLYEIGEPVREFWLSTLSDEDREMLQALDKAYDRGWAEANY